MKATLSTLVLLAAAGSQLGATNCGQVIDDAGFDLWCGDSLCSWQVESGTIQKAPTWSRADLGVALVDDGTAISQTSPVDSIDGTCLELDVIANIDPGVEVDLGVDVRADRTIDYTQRIPSAAWQPQQLKLLIAPPYNGIRFVLTKHGDGTAVLANIGAEISQGCDGLTAIVGGPAPDGATCGSDGDCTSGLCTAPNVPPMCVSCRNYDGYDDCQTATTGLVCGYGDPTSSFLDVPIECVPPAARGLGEQCLDGRQCASLTCYEHACSVCDPEPINGITGCGSGETCGPGWPTPYGIYTPYVCSPGAGVRTTGEPCAADADCASGACHGFERAQCADGRACGSDADCPSDGDVQAGACAGAGLEDGTCS